MRIFVECKVIMKWYVTVSEPAAVTNSCRALTERACSITNTHCDRSGGMFYNHRMLDINTIHWYRSVTINNACLVDRYAHFH